MKAFAPGSVFSLRAHDEKLRFLVEGTHVEGRRPGIVAKKFLRRKRMDTSSTPDQE